LTDRFVFDNEGAFKDKLKELVKSGLSPENIQVNTPYHVHGIDEILSIKPSWVRLFALVGGLAGAAAGYWFTSFTSLDWPLISGGKPMVSIPPFTIIAFELMVLFGSLSAFLGFVFLSHLPNIKQIISDEGIGDDFEINVERGSG